MLLFNVYSQVYGENKIKKKKKYKLNAEKNTIYACNCTIFTVAEYNFFYYFIFFHSLYFINFWAADKAVLGVWLLLLSKYR